MKFTEKYFLYKNLFTEAANEMGQCANICLKKTHEYLKKGVDDFKIVLGKIYEKGTPKDIRTEPGMTTEHYWIEKDGKIEEPTPTQIKSIGLEGVVEYEPIKKFTPEGFIKHMKKTKPKNE